MVFEFTTITVILFSTGHCQEIFAQNQAINLLRGICLSLRILENDNNLVDQNNVRLLAKETELYHTEWHFDVLASSWIVTKGKETAGLGI